MLRWLKEFSEQEKSKDHFVKAVPQTLQVPVARLAEQFGSIKELYVDGSKSFHHKKPAGTIS